MSISIIKVSDVDSADIDADILQKFFFHSISWYKEEEYMFYAFLVIQNVLSLNNFLEKKLACCLIIRV